MDNYRIVNKSYPKHESIEKVTGQARYTDDLEIPGAVYGRILRSPYAHARVLRIDKSEAEKVPGVLGILLPEDVPNKLFNCTGNPPTPSMVHLIIKDEKVLTDHPLHVGDRIAAVAAVTPEACEEALDKIKVDYQPLDPIFEVEEAIAKQAPLLHPELFESNVCKKIEVHEGDIEKGFQESDYIFEEDYYTPAVQHVVMEPVGCICHYTQKGELTVWSPSQTPFQDRRILAELLDLKESSVRVIKPFMGGGFGARTQLHNQHVGALLSKLIKKPVKIINTREEEMYASVVRHGSICRLKVGVSKDGRIKAFHAKVYLNTGAYCNHGAIVTAALARKFQYRVANYLYEGYCIYTNAPVAGAMRGYGNPQLTFAREVLMDKIAKELRIDPLQFRMINHAAVGDRLPRHLFPLQSCSIKECVEAGEEIMKEIEEKEVSNAKNEEVSEAWGMAFCSHCSGPSNYEGLSSCIILVNDDGSVSLMVGSADMGQGCETTLSQIAAEGLGVELEDVAVKGADTLDTPYDMGAFASSEIYLAGNAVYQAAVDVRDKLKLTLSNHYKTMADKVRYESGHYKILTELDDEILLTFKEAVSKVSFGMQGTVIIGSSSFRAQDCPPPFSVCWAKVAVDRVTKFIEVRHIIEVVDVGTAINPKIVEGQVEGGISMGLGYALMEQIEIDKKVRKPLSSDLLHYKIPTTLDMPKIHVHIVKGFEPTGPFGAKSVGELPVIPVAAAIVNAVSNATGEEIRHLPLSRDYIPHRIMSERHRDG